MDTNYFEKSLTQLSIQDGVKYYFHSLGKLETQRVTGIYRLPMTLKILLESLLRHADGKVIQSRDIEGLLNWEPKNPRDVEIPFYPSRVILQDFTGVPALVDLASMRTAMHRMGGDPGKINPLLPVELVIDHSVQIDFYGNSDALQKNMEMEFSRNRERYEFLKWGQESFDNFQVIPPSGGIVHQVNLEYLARGVEKKKFKDGYVLFPDSLVGTDSHTTMINGLGILGWGVGGIEAEAVMLGQPIYMLLPEVVGFKLKGILKEGVTATDLALYVTEILRKNNVVGKFVEFFGPGLSSLTLPDRATIANMAPEYGATVSFFPMDQMSLLYLSHTGRSEELIRMVEAYSRAQGLFRTDDVPDPDFSEIVELDLSKVEPSISGPKRPQDRMTLSEVKNKFINLLRKPIKENGYGLENLVARPVLSQKELTHGSVVIASITSCTNTSNPSVLLAAGLLAKKAVEFGLEIPSFVKTSLAPGSRVVTEYLKEAGLVPYLEKLGFHIVGYGCTTCIGNSGPLAPEIVEKIESEKLVAASVLSGNRNFEGRIHANVRANFLASPPLVIAYALAGRMDIDLLSEPLGKGKNGQDVFLKDLWPQSQEISLYLAMAENPQTYLRIYGDINSYNPAWNEISFNKEELFPWDHRSTYIQNPPFFDELSMDLTPPKNIEKARVLLKVGDSITTDHISPAGSISAKSPAGEYLVAQGVEMKDFNSYGSRRGNDRVMVRGTFANIRLKNLLAEGKEGGYTKYFPEGKIESVYSAAQKYQKAAIPLIVLAGKDYGMGSSRDWAAKGANLLGIKAVIADSYERIHRSNLVGMGVLPLQFLPGENCDKLGLSGEESYDIFLEDHLSPKSRIQVAAFIENGGKKDFQVILRIDTQTEIEYYQNGGILQYVLRKFLNKEA